LYRIKKEKRVRELFLPHSSFAFAQRESNRIYRNEKKKERWMPVVLLPLPRWDETNEWMNKWMNEWMNETRAVPINSKRDWRVSHHHQPLEYWDMRREVR